MLWYYTMTRVILTMINCLFDIIVCDLHIVFTFKNEQV